uniref:Core-binding (CB) domain-containing protein n=1 Tax=Xenopus tropicalis TaxID=8364 RepID=A0A803JZL7_XENTR
MKVFLPGEKVLSLRTAIKSLIQSRSVTIRQAMRVLGLMTSSLEAVPWARAHMRSLQEVILKNWDKNILSLDRFFHVNLQLKKDLRWWLSGHNLTQGKSFQTPEFLRLTTDASASGWGAHLGGQVVQGKWSYWEKSQSSNFRELRTVRLTLQKFRDKIKGCHSVGQFYNSILHKPSRRNKSPSVDEGMQETDVLGRKPSEDDQSCSYKRRRECAGRQTQQENSKSERVGTQFSGFSQDSSDVGLSINRSDGLQIQQEGSSVLLLGEIRQSQLPGCNEHSLEIPSLLHFSSSSDDPKGDSENQTGQSSSNPNCPILAEKSLVYGSNSPEQGVFLEVTNETRSSPSRSDVPPKSRQIMSDSLEIDRDILTVQGLSEEVVDTLLNSRKSSTSRIYRRIWKVFQNWALEKEIVPKECSIPNVLQFLQDGFSKGLKPNTLKVHVSALSVMLSVNLANNQLVILKTLPFFRPKITSSNNLNSQIVLPSFSLDSQKKLQSLDVRRCLLLYIERSKEFRKSEHLFVLFAGKRKGCKASKPTIASWVR